MGMFFDMFCLIYVAPISWKVMRYGWLSKSPDLCRTCSSWSCDGRRGPARSVHGAVLDLLQDLQENFAVTRLYVVAMTKLCRWHVFDEGIDRLLIHNYIYMYLWTQVAWRRRQFQLALRLSVRLHSRRAGRRRQEEGTLLESGRDRAPRAAGIDDPGLGQRQVLSRRLPR